MIGATIAERSEADNQPPLRSDASGARGSHAGLAKELLQPLLEERLGEATEDAVLQIRARRAVRAPDLEVDAHQPVASIREGAAHVLGSASNGCLGYQQGELVGKLPGRQADLTLPEDFHVAGNESDHRRPE